MGRTADFTGVSDYKVIPAGQYEAEVASYDWRDPKADGKNRDLDPDTGKPYQYANVKWIVREETDADGNPVEGHVVYNTYSKNPKSLFAMRRDAIALGEDPEAFGSETDLDDIMGNMVGRSGLISVVKDSFTKEDGSVRESNKITKVEALSNTPTSVSARR